MPVISHAADRTREVARTEGADQCGPVLLFLPSYPLGMVGNPFLQVVYAKRASEYPNSLIGS